MKKQRSQDQQKSSSMGLEVSGHKSQTPPETSSRGSPQRETTPTRGRLLPGITPRGTSTLSGKSTFSFTSVSKPSYGESE